MKLFGISLFEGNEKTFEELKKHQKKRRERIAKNSSENRENKNLVTYGKSYFKREKGIDLLKLGAFVIFSGAAIWMGVDAFVKEQEIQQAKDEAYMEENNITINPDGSYHFGGMADD